MHHCLTIGGGALGSNVTLSFSCLQASKKAIIAAAETISPFINQATYLEMHHCLAIGWPLHDIAITKYCMACIAIKDGLGDVCEKQY